MSTDHRQSVRSDFIERLGFEPDSYQLEAFDEFDDGDNVVVSAPTGAGKTLVAEYAVAQTLAGGSRLFYTTPIKALSNQKFNDLAAEYGSSEVGLLTGDHAINPGAPVVVMTTEVLRNMLYAGAPPAGLSAVVLDEVHYLQDAYRGPVWEEVIIHLPHSIQLVCLSATVSNSSELADWIGSVRGSSSLIVETKRPVDLEHLYLVGERNGSHLHMTRVTKGQKANPKGFRFDIDPRNNRNRGQGNRHRYTPKRRWRTPRRVEVVSLLNHKGLLPCIYFIFSRAACSDAAAAVTSSGAIFTTEREREQVIEIVTNAVSSMNSRDLKVLGYDQFRAGLEVGVASHHAGMVPAFKEAVEACFVAGLVKVVFATETLALGINMPARTVVIEKLTKFTGDHHEPLTPAQYTQLTGRAGRRGIDDEGTAVVIWSPWVRFQQVADLALSRKFVLTSSFRPTYNMAANLLRRHDVESARQLLDLSFAQFRADSGIVKTEIHVQKLTERHKQMSNRIARDWGPVSELRAALGDQAKPRSIDANEIGSAIARLNRGEVISVDGAHLPDSMLVISVAFRKGARAKVRSVDRHGEVHELDGSSLNDVPEVVGLVELPEPYLPNSASFIHEASKSLAKLVPARSSNRRGGNKHGGKKGGKKAVKQAERLARRGALSDTHHSIDVPPAARKALRRLDRIESDLDLVSVAARNRAQSLGAQFDRVLGVLADHGHVVDNDRDDELDSPDPTDTQEATKWSLTKSGQRLARLYHESDLLVLEAMEAGIFDDLAPAELAAMASVFAYEERRAGNSGEPWFPTDGLRRRFVQLQGFHLRLVADENDARLQTTRAPDAGFMAMAHGWAAGGALSDVLSSEEMTGGDFVRTVKQLEDLLRQLGVLSPNARTAANARIAAEAIKRDVVVSSSTVEAANDDGDREG